MPHGVLDVVAEHPQEQHIGEQVDDVAVQELIGDQRQALRASAPVSSGIGDGPADQMDLEQLGRASAQN